MFYTKNPQASDIQLLADFKSGERGIRTPGTSQFNGFQDRRDRPLRHLSSVIWRLCYRLTVAKLDIFI